MEIVKDWKQQIIFAKNFILIDVCQSLEYAAAIKVFLVVN